MYLTILTKQQLFENHHDSLIQFNFCYLQVLNHTLQSPAFYVGQGRTVFVEALGNFHVRNYIQEKIALRRFSNVQKTNTSDVYNFTDGGIYTVILKNSFVISIFFYDINENTYKLLNNWYYYNDN